MGGRRASSAPGPYSARMPRRRLRIPSSLTALALVAVVAAGCSTTDEQADAAASPSSTASAASSAPSSIAATSAPPTTDATPDTTAPAPPTTEAAPATTSDDADEPTATATPVSPEVEALIDERPVNVIVPDDLDAAPAPLVVVLHGYSGTGPLQDLYFGFRDEAARRGALLVHPNGTDDQRGMQFWNATDACCNFFGSEVDDVAYLTAVVEYANSVHPVDPSRVYLAGHSNGGFMSYRLACERPDLFAAIVSLAGAMVADESTCTPDEPVSVVQVHGTLDDVIRYDGGDILGNTYPSAADTTGDWASLNGCEPSIEPGDALDLETDLTGDETTVARYTGCPDGVGVELWTIPGGSHLPKLGPGFAAAVFDFFEAHPDE